MENKTQITFEEFLDVSSKLEITIGRITAVDLVPKSYGVKLTVDFGLDIKKTAFTNLGKEYKPKQLLGLVVPFVTNLVPRDIKGVTSEVMIMVGTDLDGKHEFADYNVGTRLN